MPAKDAKEPHTKGSLRVAKLIACQRPFPVDFFVPIAGVRTRANLTFSSRSHNQEVDAPYDVATAM